MTFEDEIAAGFAELTAAAGAVASFGVATFPVVVGQPTPAQQQVDIALGRPHTVRVEALRADLPSTRPKPGDTITIRGVAHAVAEVQKHDATDPTVVFICRTVGLP